MCNKIPTKIMKILEKESKTNVSEVKIFKDLFLPEDIAKMKKVKQCDLDIGKLNHLEKLQYFNIYREKYGLLGVHCDLIFKSGALMYMSEFEIDICMFRTSVVCVETKKGYYPRDKPIHECTFGLMVMYAGFEGKLDIMKYIIDKVKGWGKDDYEHFLMHSKNGKKYYGESITYDCIKYLENKIKNC